MLSKKDEIELLDALYHLGEVLKRLVDIWESASDILTRDALKQVMKEHNERINKMES